MCVSKVQHMTGRKTGCNWSRPVFFSFSIFWQTSQLATEKIQNLCNRNQWSGLLQLGSVRFRSFFQSSELDLRTLVLVNGHVAALLLLLLRAVSVTPLSCNHCLSLLYIVLCCHRGLSSMHCVIVIHRCQNCVMSSLSVMFILHSFVVHGQLRKNVRE